MTTILTSAQAFGYGPCSKLVNIVKKYKKINKSIKFDFIGEDVALIYATNNNVFDDVYDLKNLNNLDKGKYQKLISVMDPQFTLWGYINNIESLTVDSLYWYWNWKDNYFPKVQQIIKKLKETKDYKQALKLLNKLEPHHQQYVGHFMSNKSFVQTFLNDAKNKKNDRYRMNINPITIRPIIDDSYKQKSKKDTIVISLAGFLSPLNREEEAIEYFKFINEIFKEIIQYLPKNIKILYTINPKLIKHIKHLPCKFTITSLNNTELLKLLNKTIVIFTPAGVTTTYEALEYNVPLVYLPEQHDGHYQNFLRITNTIIKDESKAEIFPNLLINNRIQKEILDDPDSEINRIKYLIKNINQKNNDLILENFKRYLIDIIKKILNNKHRDKLLKQQKKVIFSNINNIGYNIEDVII